MVSVIVPVYNAEKYIETCIKSIMDQTFKDIEIIIINDGSNDKSWSICERLANKDKRIKMYSIENNGVSNARNLGIRYSKGDRILFVDSDDYLSNNIVENLYNSMIFNNSDIAMCGYYKVYEENIDKTSTYEYKCKNYNGSIEGFVINILDYLYPPILQSPCWKLFNRKIIIDNNLKFNINMDLGEDIDFVLKYLKYCKNITCTNEELYFYRVYGNSSLSTIFRNDKLDMYLNTANRYKELENAINVETKYNYSIIICNSFISLMNELIERRSMLPRQKTIELTNSFIEQDIIKQSFKNCSCYSLKYKILKHLISLNSSIIIYYYFYFINKIKYWRRK